MVENAGNAPMFPGDSKGSVPQPAQATDGERLFMILADQHRASLDQVDASQAMAYQQMWNRVAQLMLSQQPAPALTASASTRQDLLSSMWLQKMTLE